MSKIELIEYIEAPDDAMVRQFHCACCNKIIGNGKIARVWVLYQEGYAAQAHAECLEVIPG